MAQSKPMVVMILRNICDQENIDVQGTSFFKLHFAITAPDHPVAHQIRTLFHIDHPSPPVTDEADVPVIEIIEKNKTEHVEKVEPQNVDQVKTLFSK